MNRNDTLNSIQIAMLTSILAATALSSSVSAQDGSVQNPAIPYCGERQDRTISRRLLFVTTLDGNLNALDISTGGTLLWSISTQPGPLISSSIHRLELTNNGHFVRMIPSLSGGIYKFDGESIDPIPITTEHLLSSSSKFSDDLVISGGKETRTYGVCARTGILLYECSMNGCINTTNANSTYSENSIERSDSESPFKENNIHKTDNYKIHDPLVDDVVVVRRHTQTVRAVESRTGVERWNFSVGQHELDLIKASECHDKKFSDTELAILNLDFRVIVPEGLIIAFSKSDPEVILWKHKFDHPIVSIWKVDGNDNIAVIDMFGSLQWNWNQHENIYGVPVPSTAPSIYLGMYQKQLYIQESSSLHNEIVEQSNLFTHLTTDNILPKIPWRPIVVSSNSLIMFDKTSESESSEERMTFKPQGNELVPYREDGFAVSAQSVLNASEYVNGNGFYFYTRNDWDDFKNNSTCEEKQEERVIDKNSSYHKSSNSSINDELGFNLDDIDAPVKVVILSLWFWWKEISVIAITSALLLNLFLGQRSRLERQIVYVEKHMSVPTAIEATESSTAALLGPTISANGVHVRRSLTESTSSCADYFISRFQGDFDLVRCLGRGGFGVVFEAKNKLDDCTYAVKRITLPNKKESRDRVMREVKTLANCEHQNIVRYFQAWVETPPLGWQEAEDVKLLAHETSMSIQIDTPSNTNMDTANADIAKKYELASWVSSVASSTCSSAQEYKIVEDNEDYSSIIFRSESQSEELQTDNENSSRRDENNVSETGVVSIDIHSNSFDLNLNSNCKPFDYSQLSDSFQIEFVRSASGVERTSDENSKNTEILSCFETNRHKRNFIEELKKEQTNQKNCKALLPALTTGTTTTIERPRENKVYLYIQMQLCRKESLRDWLREHKSETRKHHIASIFHQIVDAVDYVHVKGLIHRDLKPSNIFFSQNGQIKIGDFGLVTDMSEIPNLQSCDKTGLLTFERHTKQVGTHLYMSPEQLKGLHYDFRVDIYSLGLIFFELLVFFGTEMERIVTLQNLREGHYPQHFPCDHPHEYSLLKLMLSVNPEDRPPTLELKLRLNDILKLPEYGADGDVLISA